MQTIYQVLQKDHDTVKELLNELVSMKKDSPRRTELLAKIRDELVPHSRAEEAVFYNSLRSVPVVQDEAWHGYREHLQAESILRSLQVAKVFDVGFQALAKKLKEVIEHHVEEEENELFALAQGVVTKEESEQMATAFTSLKPKIREQSFMGTTVDMIANMMPPRFSRSFKEGHKTLWKDKKAA
jgi:hemerythrin superfamily protein